MAAKSTLTNKDVIAWAIDESGYTVEELASLLSKEKADAQVIEQWLAGQSTPTRGQLTTLAEKLRRPRTLFYLPEPPPASLPPTLRTTPGSRGRQLQPKERLAVREARRRQRFVSELLHGSPAAAIPTAAQDDEPGLVGSVLREWAGVPSESQPKWNDNRAAYRAWKGAIENRGILVMELELGDKGLRGFAMSDPFAPTVAIGTAQNDAARSFTLWHEVAHLCLHAEASCLDPSSGPDSATERWCEEVASAVLIPQPLIEVFLDMNRNLFGFDLVEAVAQKFRASLRATAVALNRVAPELGDLYGIVEERAPFRDREKRRGGRGGGQPRPARRLRESGRVASRVLIEALSEDRISELEARRILKLDGDELSQLSTLIKDS